MEDTIVAISTALGVGAISIIRVSGNEAINIVNKITKFKKLDKVATHTINYDYIVENNKIIDEVLISIMKSPKTFTKEDIVEINCHGGIATTNKVLELLLTNGCRLAEPGEFTKRAFLNGRIDLIEAEGVMDLINSKTEISRNLAINQVNGSTSQLIKDLRQSIIEILANIEVNIDYPEYEDIEEMTTKMLGERISNIEDKIKEILNKSENGKIVKEGINVALIGRPNVGKSTLFNRLVGSKIAIIEDVPGITRDRIYGEVKFDKYSFHLIDTGGIDFSDETFNNEIKIQAEIAIDEADVIVFVVDAKAGITQNDLIIRDLLMKSGKKVIVAVNKIDSKLATNNIYDFYELGFDNYINISSEQNEGIYELLLEITKDFKEVVEEENDIIKFSVIGRPNVGKSSLVNAILNEERVIVSNIAGTTRDAIDTPFTYHNEKFVVIDTAGMRKKGKIYETVEKYSLLRSMKAIDRSDVCLLVIDAETGIIEHDKHIAGYAIEAGKPIVIVVNKWDTVEEKDEKMKQFTKDIRNNFQFMPYAPIVYLSALTKKRMHTLMPQIIKVYKNSNKMIATNLINDCIKDAYNLNLPPSYKGKRLKIYFCNQVSNRPPTFNIQVNSKGLIHFSYERYLENKIRESFDFEGTPIVLQFKNKGETNV